VDEACRFRFGAISVVAYRDEVVLDPLALAFVVVAVAVVGIAAAAAAACVAACVVVVAVAAVAVVAAVVAAVPVAPVPVSFVAAPLQKLGQQYQGQAKKEQLGCRRHLSQHAFSVLYRPSSGVVLDASPTSRLHL